MTWLIRASGTGLLLALASGPAIAANPKEIDTAIQRGTAALYQRYKNPAGVGGGGVIGGGDANHGIGPMVLSAIAMLEGGVRTDDPVMKALAANIRNASYQQTQTYQLSLCVMFLDRYGDPADIPLIQVLGVRLLAGQTSNGVWSYSCVESVPQADEQWLKQQILASQKAGNNPTAPELNRLHPVAAEYAKGLATRPRMNAAIGGDNSNTQFAVIAVWLARRNGLPVEAALEMSEKLFMNTQFQDGTWGYVSVPMGGRLGATPSMICAGLIGIATGIGRREQRAMRAEAPPSKVDPPSKETPSFFTPAPKNKKPQAKPGEAPRKDARDFAAQRGLAALGAYLAADMQAGQGRLKLNGVGAGERDGYFLWSLERVSVIYGVEQLGGVDWYAAGAEYLIRSDRCQGQDGLWEDTIRTSFAILFLTRSNLARDLSTRVQKNARTELRATTAANSDSGSGGGSLSLPDPALKGPTTTAEVRPTTPTRPTTTPVSPKPPAAADVGAKLAAELVRASGGTWDAALRTLREAKGGEHTRALTLAIHQLDGNRKNLAREALAERLTRMTADTLRTMMRADDPELRRGAVLGAAMKDDAAHIPDLIDRLSDTEDLVVRAARAGLKSLSGGRDFGPETGATKAQRTAAAAAWRAWWQKQK